MAIATKSATKPGVSTIGRGAPPLQPEAVSAVLTISSKTYSSWSLRGWLLCRMAGLAFTEASLSIDDPGVRQELLLLSPSILVPRLDHGENRVWDTLAIAEYLAEIHPEAGLWPSDRAARAHCRSISGEMHSGFQNLRSTLPMNLKAQHKKFPIFVGAQPDIDRVITIWRNCYARYGGPFLFGPAPTVADAMFAPVCARFRTYDVMSDAIVQRYVATIFAWGPMAEWVAAAQAEPDDLDELEVEF